jgi:hypothetical protein
MTAAGHRIVAETALTQCWEREKVFSPLALLLVPLFDPTPKKLSQLWEGEVVQFRCWGSVRWLRYKGTEDRLVGVLRGSISAVDAIRNTNTPI